MYFLKAKSDTTKATERFLADTAPYGSVKCIRSDNGTEYTSKEFQELLNKNGIRHETSAPYSPHQNGTAERNWRTLFEMARCMITESGLPKELWTYAVMAAAIIRNRCYNNRIEQTPYYMLTGKKPDLSKMRVFGSVCYAFKQEKKKLDAKCENGRFVGFDKNSPALLVYYPDTGKVLKHRLVKFITTGTVEHETQTDLAMTDDVHGKRFASPMPKPKIDDQTPKESQESNMANPEMTPRQGTIRENEQLTGDSYSVRYPGRDRNAPRYLNDYVSDIDSDDQVLNNADYCYRMVCGVPQSFDEAKRSTNSQQWVCAMKEEITSLKENDTYTLTTLPQGKDVVGGK